MACLVPVWIGVALFVYQNAFSVYDDSYIFFRYADNVLAGCGLRFNCGDAPVEGYSSPLYLLLLVAARSVTHDLAAVSQMVGATCMVGALSWAVASAWSARWTDAWWARGGVAALAACMFALDHQLLLNAVTGMDTALACALVSLWWWALVTQRFRVVAWVLPFVVLARPEGIVLLLIAPIHPRARWWPSLAPAVVALGVLLLHRWWTFHALLPNPYWVKAGGTWRHAELGWAYIVDLLQSEPLVALAPLTLMSSRTRREIGWLLVAAAVWFGFFLRSGGDSFLYHRLAMPLVPPLIVAGLQGVAALALRLEAWLQVPMLARGAPKAMLVATALVVPWGWREHRFQPMHAIPEVERWEMVGKYLQLQHPGASVATVPIGAIGYFSRTHVIDMVGLTAPPVAHAGGTVPPQLLKRNWIGHERHNTDWVLAQKPQLIVMLRWRDEPWQHVGEAVASFWAEWLLLRRIKSGQAPYEIYSAPITPDIHWLMFRRLDGS